MELNLNSIVRDKMGSERGLRQEKTAYQRTKTRYSYFAAEIFSTQFPACDSIIIFIVRVKKDRFRQKYYENM